jgi:integrase-like protein
MVRDSSLENRTARLRLTPRIKPYWRLLRTGLHIGYRRLPQGAGTWVVRSFLDGKYSVVNLRGSNGLVVAADDYGDANGDTVMSFAQAQDAANGGQQITKRSDNTYTVREAVEDYQKDRAAAGRTQANQNTAKYIFDKHVLPAFGDAKVSSLTTARLRSWRDAMVRGEGDARRASMVSANRVWGMLRAVLNFALAEKKVQSGEAWHAVKAYKRVNRARTGYLTITEAQRLLNCCDPDFRPIVQGALQTGCRYSELARLVVSDFNPAATSGQANQASPGTSF